MKIYVTGNKGFIAKNIATSAKKYMHEVCNENDNECDVVSYSESLANIKKYQPDFIVHNAAIVGTDVCHLNQVDTHRVNIIGTKNISSIAKDLQIPLLYISTTVIFDVFSNEVQSGFITENTPIKPHTLYAKTKYEGEKIVKSAVDNFIIMRPLFCYGGVGDMNSLVSKAIHSSIAKCECPIFLSKEYKKSYMYAEDFSDAIIVACEDKLFGQDFNISCDETKTIGEYFDIISSKIDTKLVEFFPKTDYLKNHLVSNEKFKNATNWKPKVLFTNGLDMAIKSYKNNTEFNPLKHIQSAKIDKNFLKIYDEK